MSAQDVRLEPLGYVRGIQAAGSQCAHGPIVRWQRIAKQAHVKNPEGKDLSLVAGDPLFLTQLQHSICSGVDLGYESGGGVAISFFREPQFVRQREAISQR